MVGDDINVAVEVIGREVADGIEVGVPLKTSET
jgi:hypothetical protein